MGYYAVRLFRSFKGGVLSYGWKYICVAVPFLIFGELATSMGGSQSITVMQGEILRSAGVALSLFGGIMIVIGFRAQFNVWNPKGMKQENEQVVSASQSERA